MQKSYLALRFGLAFVFLWFAIDKFSHPNYWLNVWISESIVSLAGNIGLSRIGFVYLLGVFEVLVGAALISTVFIRFFSTLAALFLLSIVFFIGFGEIAIRDIGLMGGFIALALWPRK